MSTSSEELASTSEELATNSEEMLGQAEQLKELVAWFKINNNANEERQVHKMAGKKVDPEIKRNSYSSNNNLQKKPLNQNKNFDYQAKNKGVNLNMFNNTDKNYENY